jgi:hypothetical protein
MAARAQAALTTARLTLLGSSAMCRNRSVLGAKSSAGETLARISHLAHPVVVRG